MSSTPRRRRAWKIAAALAGGVSLLVALLWGWIRLVESRKWSALEGRVAELNAVAAPANPMRRPLHGEPAQGNGWDDYGQALSVFANMKPGETRQVTQVLDEFRSTDDPLVKARAAEILKEYRVSADAVRRGARRATAQLPLPEFDGEKIAALASLLREAALGERPDEALEILLDLLQFGVDLDAAGHPSGARACEKSVDALHGIFGVIPRERRMDLDQALLRVERSLSLTRSLERNLRSLGEEILKRPEGVSALAEFMDGKWAFTRSSWRYGFSKRHLVVDAFNWVDHWTRQVDSWEQLPYAQVRAAAAEQEKAIEACPNRVAHYMAVLIRWVEPERHRGLLARIRLLRRACGAEGLQDPFGGLLSSVLEGEILRIWSVGIDGVDGGGKGGWVDQANADIVMEVRVP